MTARQNKPLPPCRGRGRGFTMIEVVLSIAIMSIILIGAGSAVLVGTRAIDDKTDTPANISAADEAMRQITTDVRMATSFIQRTSTAIEFKVPSRDGNASDDTIRYSWSGVAGDPLLRSYNGGADVAVAENVHHLDFTYLTQVLNPADGEQESDELLLIYHDDTDGLDLKDHRIEEKKWPGTYFKPTLPANTVSWSVTRVKVLIKGEGADDCELTFQIRPAGGDEKPDDEVIEGIAFDESVLPDSHEWFEVSFSSVTELDPDKGYCLVLAQTDGGGRDKAGKVKYEDDGAAMTDNAHFVKTDRSVDKWKSESTKDLLFYVYGTVITDGPAEWP